MTMIKTRDSSQIIGIDNIHDFRNKRNDIKLSNPDLLVSNQFSREPTSKSKLITGTYIPK